MPNSIKKSNVVVLYPELSYAIGGILFRVFTELGSGYQEKHLQRAVAAAFREANLPFEEQVMSTLEFEGKVIGRYYFDFVVDGKIVLELKVGERFYRQHYDQIKQYLMRSGLKLGLLARFGNHGVVINRILQPRSLL